MARLMSPLVAKEKSPPSRLFTSLVGVLAVTGSAHRPGAGGRPVEATEGVSRDCAFSRSRAAVSNASV